nr:protein psiD isoform X3 [Parasteatoda tepidariorum]
MHEYMKSKLIRGTVLCLAMGIFLLDSHVDASAVKSRSSSKESSKESNNDSFKCPCFVGILPHPNDCSKYYICAFFIPRLQTCGKNFLFDGVHDCKLDGKCKPEEEVNCGSRKRPTNDKMTTDGIVETTTPKDVPFQCPSFGGYFPDPNDCSKYYQCTFFSPRLRTCRNNFLFDGVKKQCKPGGEVNCGSRKRPTSETTVGTTPIPTTPEPTTTTSQPTTTPPTTAQPTTTPPTTTQPTTTPPTTTQPTTTPPTTTQPTTTPPTTAQPTTPTPKPTGPPETDCDEDDLDCIIKETGDISAWFECPEAIGAYRHPSSNKLFIFCKNWKPLVKKCGQKSIYSEQMRTCITP